MKELTKVCFPVQCQGKEKSQNPQEQVYTIRVSLPDDANLKPHLRVEVFCDLSPFKKNFRGGGGI